MNLCEIALQVRYLFVRRTDRPHALIIGLVGSTMTVWKTFLYWLQEYYSGYAMVGHNNWQTLIFLWVIPNGAWLIFPGYLTWAFAQEIYDNLVQQKSSAKPKTR